MNLETFTPKFFTLILNVIFFVFLIICFLIGFKRGYKKALYFFAVTLLIIIGCWLIFPAIFKFIINIDISAFNITIPISQDQSLSITSIANAVEQVAAIYVTPEEGQAITDTSTYALLLAIIEMPVRIVFILIILILNWTLFRLIFGICYRIITPAKKDKYGIKKRISIVNRLIGGGIGLLNALFIFLIFCVPFAGVFSIGEDASVFVEMAAERNENKENNTQNTAYLTIDHEVIRLDSESASIANFQLSQLDQWFAIYRDTAAGRLFSMKFAGVELDNKIFDNLIAIDFNESKVSIRKEIHTLASGASIIMTDLIEPLMSSDEGFKAEMLDKLDSEMISGVFKELSELEIIGLAMPVGVEILPGFIKTTDNENKDLYIQLVDASKELKKVDFKSVIAETGEFVAALYDCMFDSEFKPSDLIGVDDEFASVFLDRLVDLDSKKVEAVFDKLASIELVDAINNIGLSYIEKSNIVDAKINPFLLIKPIMTVSEDGYLVLNDVKTDIPYQEEMDFDKFSYSLDENKNWKIEYVINEETFTKETNISGELSQMTLSFEGVKLSDEIRNISNLVNALKVLSVNSISDLQEFIQSGKLESGKTINLDAFTYENVHDLYSALFGFKIISLNVDNVDVIVNNVLPNDLRGSINLKGINESDLTSVTMAAKILYDSGIVDGLVKTEGEEQKEIDYVKLIDENGDAIVDNLLDSKLISENITPVANAMVSMFIGKDKFNIPEVNWQDEGRDMLKGILNVVSVGLKYKDKFSDLSSLTDENLDEIFAVLKENVSNNIIVKSNMNNIIRYVQDIESFKTMNIQLRTFDTDDEWTTVELDSIVDALKILVKLLKVEEGQEFNVTKLFTLTEDNIDTILNSRFIVKVLVANLIEYAKPGNQLEEYLVVNMSEEDSGWDNELDVILKMLIKLMKDITDLNDEDITNKLVKNLTNLSTDSTDSSDDISRILSSNVLTDSLAKIIKSLPEKTDGLIVVNDTEAFPINWRDTNLKSGEIRTLVKGAKSVLVDDEGNVIIDELNDYTTEQFIDLLTDISDSEAQNISQSRILVDTIAKKLVDMSNEENAFLTLADNYKTLDWNQEFFNLWSNEVNHLIISAKTLVIDKNGNSMASKLINGDNNELLSVIIELGDDDVKIGKVLDSDTIYETIKAQVKKLSENSGGSEAIISMPTGEDDIDLWTKPDWKVELKAVIYAIDKILTEEVDDPDNPGEKIKQVNIDKLSSSDANKLLQVIVDLTDEELDKSLDSRIITATISKQILKLGEEGDDKIVNTKSVLDYNLASWRTEIVNIVNSVELLVCSEDEFGKKTVDTSVLSSGDTDATLQMITDLDNGKDELGIYHPENDEIEKVLTSVVILDTISERIVKIADENNAIIKVKDDVRDYSQSEWKGEIRSIIESSKILLTDDAGNVSTENLNSGDTNKILKLVADMDDGYDELGIYHEEKDEVAEVLKSVIISDTISDKIINLGVDEEGNPDDSKTLVVKNVYNYSREEWQGTQENHYNGEIRKIIKASNNLLREDDPENPGEKRININKVTESSSEELFELICNLKDDELDEVVESTLFTDTISKQIISFDTTLTITDEVKAYSTDEWRVETVRLVKSGRLVVGEKVADKYTIEMNKVSSDSNYVINNLANLNDNPNGENDELGTALASIVIRDTLVKKIKDQGKDAGNGGILIIDANMVWDDEVNNDVITNIGEIRRIIRGLRIIFEEEDPMNPGETIVDIKLENVTANEILSRTRELDNAPSNMVLGTVEESDEIGVLVQSRIISDTIIDTTITESEKPGATIIVSYDKDSEEWHDSYSGTTFTTSGELRRMLASVKYLFKGEESISLNSFNVDNILNLTKDEENVVFDSNVLLETFYSEIHKLNAGSSAKVLFIPDGMQEDKPEAIRFIESVKVVKGDKQIKDLNSTQFSLDTFIKDGEGNYKTDEEYDRLFASLIIKYSASIRSREYMISTGSLAKYMELGIDYNENIITGTEDEQKNKQVEMIEEDIENLIKVIRDLEKNNGIVYTNFTFAAFENACKDTVNPDSTAKADSVSDTLANSKLIVHSLKKMMSEILSGSLNPTQMEAINLNMKAPERNYWTNYDINGNGSIDNVTIDPEHGVYDENGELRKILRILTQMDSFAKDTGTTYSSYTDKNLITKPLLSINNSLVLKGLIPTFSETALTNIKEWLYSPRPVLTKVMWDSEIDNLGDIIVTINTRGLGNLNTLDVKTANSSDLGILLKEVNKSRIININHLEGYVSSAVNNTFNTSVTVGHVYTGTDYNEKVAAWNTEIDNLMFAVEKLQAINSVDISDSSMHTDGITKKGVYNAHTIGLFLNACSDTTMLHNIIHDVFNSVMTDNGVSPAMLSILGIDIDNISDYDATLVSIATYLCA